MNVNLCQKNVGGRGFPVMKMYMKQDIPGKIKLSNNP